MRQGTPLVLVLCIAALLAGPGRAQDRSETLADIRAQASALGDELQALRRELVAGGSTGLQLGGASALERMDALEQELQRLTAKTEDLQFRIDRIVTDGTNRLGDLEFRVTELEGGDAGALATPAPLGNSGDAPAAPAAEAAPQPAAKPEGGQLAVGEQSDFDRAKAALDSGSFRSAADLFDTFAKTYTAGPLTSEAQYLRGLAESKLGETKAAAKAYLEAFSSAPMGPRAPDALVELGLSLGKLGQTPEACVMLAEASTRFPDSSAAGRAVAERQTLGCN